MTANTQPVGLTTWNRAASRKVSGRPGPMSAARRPAVAIRHARTNRHAAPTSFRTVCRSGYRSNNTPRRRPTARTRIGTPPQTPKMCGTVRRTPFFAPEAASRLLFGPGVNAAATATGRGEKASRFQTKTVRPASGPVSLPAGIHTTGATPVGGVTPGLTPGGTPPPSTDRASGQKGGVAPVISRSAGADRSCRARMTNAKNDGDKWKVGV